mmetsp:Transcript_25362/g.87505  ORF Transcript_25362/g.87505 Transcript_25362/m.87505 type:complete len:288 (+) Transcript_25362:252-1115(+)
MHAEGPSDDGTAFEVFHFSVSVTFQAQANQRELTDATRRSCAHGVVQTVALHAPELIGLGLLRLYTLSCERGTGGKFGKNLHVQACFWWASKNGVAVAIKALKAFLVGCRPRFENVKTSVFIKEQGEDQLDENLVMYVVKDEECDFSCYANSSGGPNYPEPFDVINNLREKSAPFEALRELVRTNRLTTDPGPDWAGVLRLIDVVGVETLERAAVLLASCVRADAPPGTAQFVTIHASKGLSYPWVVLADDWGPRADAEASARECYVAITRSEDGLALPASLHARLL